jgi:hypothetical protein
MKNQKVLPAQAGFILPIIIILVVLIGFVSVYYLGTIKSKSTIIYVTPSPNVEVTTLPSIVTSSKPITITDSTSNWKRYNVLNFQVKIPNHWNYIDDIIQFNDSSTLDGKSNIIGILDLSNNTSVLLKNNLDADAKALVDFEMNYAPGTSYHEPTLINSFSLEIDHQKAIRYDINLSNKFDELPYDKESFIYFYYKSKLYSINMYGDDTKTMNQILSTFKFTN